MRDAPHSLPSTGAVSGVLEALAFFRDADFARGRFGPPPPSILNR